MQAWCSLPHRTLGALIALLGIVWVSPDSLLIRLAQEEQSAEECVVFYKYATKSVVVTAFLLAWYGGPRGLFRACVKGRWHWLAAALLESITEVLFTLSVLKTTGANTLVLMNANPLWCALLSFIWFGERPARHTLAVLVLGFSCVILVFWGTRQADSDGQESIAGDLLGFGAGLVIALYLTVVRHAGIKHPDANMVSSMWLSAVLDAGAALVWAKGEVGEACYPESGVSGYGYVLIDGGIVIPVALACFALAPKYASSTVVGLIMLLEVVLGPLFLWVAAGETPLLTTAIGGGVLTMLLVAHELIALRSEQSLVDAHRGKAADDEPESELAGDAKQDLALEAQEAQCGEGRDPEDHSEDRQSQSENGQEEQQQEQQHEHMQQQQPPPSPPPMEAASNANVTFEA